MCKTLQLMFGANTIPFRLIVLYRHGCQLVIAENSNRRANHLPTRFALSDDSRINLASLLIWKAVHLKQTPPLRGCSCSIKALRS